MSARSEERMLGFQIPRESMITVFSDHHRLHNTRNLIVNGQPFIVEELPERADRIVHAVREARLGGVEPPQDFGLEPILAVHSEDYIQFLNQIYAQGKAFYGFDRPLLPETFAPRAPQRNTRHPIGQLGYYCFGTYSPILEGTWQAAYWSAQCALTAASLLRQGQSVVYALCRPPGHHAGREYYGGFCYLNNAAIAARALPGRTAILDIDFHHGNGTQDIFFTDPNVLYVSIHADPDQEYPYFWGGKDETGAEDGVGCNLNIPLPLGTGDASYLEALAQALDSVSAFKPDFLVLSVGFDILTGDPNGGFQISRAGLGQVAHQIAALSRAGLPTAIIQEGGYLLDDLGPISVQFLSAFA